MLVGCLGLAGGLLGEDALASFVPGRRLIYPFTGITGALAGLALALGEGTPGRQRASRALAWLVLGLGGLALLGGPLGWAELYPPLTGDHVLVHGRLLSLPPLPTALALTAVGLGLVSSRVSWGRVRLAEGFALVAGWIGLVNGVVHLYSAPTLYQLPGHPPTSISIPAALIFCALSLGLLSARPREGLVAIIVHPAAGGAMARRLLPWVLLAPPAVGLLVLWALHTGITSPRATLASLAAVGSGLGLALLVIQANSLNKADLRRQQAIEELARWRHLFEHADWGVVLGLPDGTIGMMNPAFAQMHGTTVEALLGKPMASLFTPAAQAALPEQLRLIHERGHHRFETEHVRQDGSVFPVVADATAVRDAEGRLLYRAVYVQDITEQAKAQAAQARLAALVESADDAIILVKPPPEGTVLAWNAGAERLYGYKAEEVLGRNINDEVVPPERRDEAAELRAALARGEPLRAHDTVRRRKDGRLIHVSLNSSPVRDAQGRVVAISSIARDISRRVAMEQALRQSEERYRSLVELAADGIFVADLEGRYTDVNSAGCRLLGLRREDVVGKTIVDLIPAQEVPRLKESRAVLDRGDIHVAEWHLRHRDGHFVPVEVSARILPDGRWLGFVRDISERKAAEAALQRARAAEQRLAAQLEAVGRAASEVTEAVANLPHTDLEAVMKTIVLQAQLLTGAQYAALGLGDDPERPMDPWVFSGMPDDVAAALGRYPRPVGVLGQVSLEGGTLRVRDLREHPAFRGFPAAHPVMTSFLGVPIRFRGQSVGNLYLASKRGAEAFTEEDQRAIELLAARAGAALEAALAYWTEAQAKSWLQQVIGQMPEGVLVTDTSGRLVTCNAMAQALLPEGGDVPGQRPVLDLRQPDGEPLSWEQTPLGQALQRWETAGPQELVIRGRDGQPVPVLMSATPLRLPSQEGPGAVCVVRNIAVLKELERLREEWTAVVAHDLRQPISVITTAASLLSKAHAGPMGAVESKALERIQSSARRLDRMIADLLDASRTEAKRLRLERVRVEPGMLVREILDRAEGSLGGRELRLEARRSYPEVRADPARLEQVLVNLLTNAVKYGEPGTPITVGIEAREGEVELRVTNRGPGLTPEEQAQLFRRFSRTGAAERSQVEGLGLGLYITRGLVEAHGGRIWVESKPGESTTFRFTLPVAGPPVEDAPAAGAP